MADSDSDVSTHAPLSLTRPQADTVLYEFAHAAPFPARRAPLFNDRVAHLVEMVQDSHIPPGTGSSFSIPHCMRGTSVVLMLCKKLRQALPDYTITAHKVTGKWSYFEADRKPDTLRS